MPAKSPAVVKERGFSTLELLIVVAVAAIVIAIALPNLLRTMEAYRLTSSASTVVGRLSDARISAIKRNRPAWVTFDAATRQLVVQIDDPANPGTNLNIAGPDTLPSGLNFVLPSPPTAQILFDSLGRTANPFTVVLQVIGTGQQKTVTITASGRVTVN